MNQVAKCLVCGEPIEKFPNVNCSACETPHHTECWNSIGGCSTFGCENQANKIEIIPVEDRKAIAKKQWIRTGLVMIGLWGFDLGIFVWNKVKQLTSFVWEKTKLLPWAIVYPILGFLPEKKLEGWLSNPFAARFSAAVVDFSLGTALFVYILNTEFFPLYIGFPIAFYLLVVSIFCNMFRNGIAFGERDKIVGMTPGPCGVEGLIFLSLLGKKWFFENVIPALIEKKDKVARFCYEQYNRAVVHRAKNLLPRE